MSAAGVEREGTDRGPDLTAIIEVRGTNRTREANALLGAGWVLLTAGADPYGSPWFTLGRREGVAPNPTEPPLDPDEEPF